MRVNEPITDREIPVSAGSVLVSRTDPGGRIAFCNADFVRISGFAQEELTGAPHNILRHPHMPKQAFADLWRTIRAGRPWEGLVKNRAKNGDFYWVRANVTPLFEEGRIAGYISIRLPPDRASVEQADRVYARLRAKDGRGIGLRDGEIVATGWRARLRTAAASVTGRIAAARRCGEETAIGRTRPLCSVGAAERLSRKANWICPEIRSGTICVMLRYAAPAMSIPARAFSSADGTWEEEL